MAGCEAEESKRKIEIISVNNSNTKFRYLPLNIIVEVEDCNSEIMVKANNPSSQTKLTFVLEKQGTDRVKPTKLSLIDPRKEIMDFEYFSDDSYDYVEIGARLMGFEVTEI